VATSVIKGVGERAAGGATRANVDLDVEHGERPVPELRVLGLGLSVRPARPLIVPTAAHALAHAGYAPLPVAA